MTRLNYGYDALPYATTLGAPMAPPLPPLDHAPLPFHMGGAMWSLNFSQLFVLQRSPPCRPPSKAWKSPTTPSTRRTPSPTGTRCRAKWPWRWPKTVTSPLCPSSSRGKRESCGPRGTGTPPSSTTPRKNTSPSSITLSTTRTRGVSETCFIRVFVFRKKQQHVITLKKTTKNKQLMCEIPKILSAFVIIRLRHWQASLFLCTGKKNNCSLTFIFRCYGAYQLYPLISDFGKKKPQ